MTKHYIYMITYKDLDGIVHLDGLYTQSFKADNRCLILEDYKWVRRVYLRAIPANEEDLTMLLQSVFYVL